nr:hypothetical protein [Tanacetum cinerariifolium]
MIIIDSSSSSEDYDCSSSSSHEFDLGSSSSNEFHSGSLSFVKDIIYSKGPFKSLLKWVLSDRKVTTVCLVVIAVWIGSGLQGVEDLYFCSGLENETLAVWFSGSGLV